METKQLIIEKTAKLIQEKGYYGTGLSDILSHADVPKGSLYHHFSGGKDELIARALEFAANQRSELFRKAMKGKPNAIEGLKAVVDIFIDEMKSSEFARGCPLATVSLDISSENEELRKVCSEMYDYWIDGIEKYLEYKGIARNVRVKAEEFMVNLEGAILLSKVQQNDKYLIQIKNQIAPLLNDKQ